MEESEADEAAGSTAQDGQEQTSSVEESVLVGQESPVNVQNSTSTASQEALQEHEGPEGLLRNSGETTTSLIEGETRDLKKITCPFCSTELFIWRYKFCFECGTSIKDIIEQLIQGNSSSSSDIQVRSGSRVRAQPGKLVVVSGFVEDTKQEVGVAEASSKGTDVQHGLTTCAPLDNVSIGSKRSSDRSSVQVDTEGNKKSKHGGESIEKNLAEVSKDSGETKEPDHDGQNIFDDGQNLPKTTESAKNGHQFYQQNEDEMDQSAEETQRHVYGEHRSEVDKNKTETTRSAKTEAETGETSTSKSSDQLRKQTQGEVNENSEKQSGKNESEAIGSNTGTSVYGQVELAANKDIQQAGQLAWKAEQKEFDDPTHIKATPSLEEEKKPENDDSEGTEELDGQTDEHVKGTDTSKLFTENVNDANTESTQIQKADGKENTEKQSGKNESEAIGNNTGTSVYGQVEIAANKDIQQAGQLGKAEQKEFEDPTHIKATPSLEEEKKPENDDSEGTEELDGQTDEHVKGIDTSKLFTKNVDDANTESTQTQKADGKDNAEDNGKTEDETTVLCREKLTEAHKKAKDVQQDNKQQSGAVKHHDIKATSVPEGGDENSKQSAEKSKGKPPETESVYKERVFGSLDEHSRSSDAKDLPRTKVAVAENPLSSESRQPGDEQGNSHDGGSSSGDGNTLTLKELAERRDSLQTSGKKQILKRSWADRRNQGPSYGARKRPHHHVSKFNEKPAKIHKIREDVTDKLPMDVIQRSEYPIENPSYRRMLKRSCHTVNTISQRRAKLSKMPEDAISTPGRDDDSSEDYEVNVENMPGQFGEDSECQSNELETEESLTLGNVQESDEETLVSDAEESTYSECEGDNLTAYRITEDDMTEDDITKDESTENRLTESRPIEENQNESKFTENKLIETNVSWTDDLTKIESKEHELTIDELIE